MYHTDSMASYKPFKVPFHSDDLNFESTSLSPVSPPSSDLLHNSSLNSPINPSFLNLDNIHHNLFYSHYNMAYSFPDPSQNCFSHLCNSSLSLERHTFSKNDYQNYQMTTHKSFSPSENTPLKLNRKRSCHINSAFSALRGCIPNVPTDTKLSKIKTLRLATNYIAYLMNVLSQEDPSVCGSFNAVVVKKNENREIKRRKEAQELMNRSSSSSTTSFTSSTSFSSSSKLPSSKKRVCRTGWPEHVWASDLKNSE